MRRLLQFCLLFVLLVSVRAGAQDGYTERARKYVDQYASLAMYEQLKNGIPAAITLGQGILETEAGNSELMVEANNHFGIKCKNGWQGPTFTHTDDAPDECFKKYSCAAESYKDHSEHLKRNPRYSPLFKIRETDYKSWAVCLKKCGYATNPQYAQKLIKIIEDFDLQQYTFNAKDSTFLKKDKILPVVESQPPMDSLVKPVAKKATLPISQTPSYASAGKFRGDTATIIVNRQHKVLAGETMAGIARAEGVELKKLMQLNLLNPNEEPVVGVTLELMAQAQRKPAVVVNPITAHKGNAIATGEEKAPAGDYIAINRVNSKTLKDTAKAKQVNIPNQVAQTPAQPTKPQPIIIIEEPNKRPVRPAERPDPNDPEVKKEAEFAALKADLDKVVYADDSKLIAENPSSVQPEKKATASPEKKVPLTPEKKVIKVNSGKSDNTYTVKKGDTAFSIAKRNNITLDQLSEWNKLGSGGVKVGQVLRVKE